MASDYLCRKIAFKKANDLIKDKSRLGLLILFGINTGLRYCDLSVLHDRDIKRAIENNNELVIIERKTNKKRVIYLNQMLIDNYNKYPKVGYLFLSNKRQVYDISNVNRRLKKIFKDEDNKNISTHSLRKTFARTYYDSAPNKEDALIRLSQMLNHSTLAMTRIYLGINKEEQNEIYKQMADLYKY